MLELRIDPTKCTPDQVRAASAFLLSMIGQAPAAVIAAPAAVLDPVDNPAVGAPTASDAAQAFGNLDKVVDQAQAAAAFGDALDPAAAFGAPGNVPPAVVGNPATSAPITASLPPVAENVPSVAGANAGIEFDRDGLPWDARIHASSKAKNADGRWRGKRGVDDAVIAQVTAELRQVAAIPTPTAGAIVAAVQAAQTAGNVGSQVHESSAIASSPGAPAPVVTAVAIPQPPVTPANPGNVPVPPVSGAPAVASATPIAAATNPATAISAESAPAPSSIDYATFIGKVTAGLTSNPPTLSQPALQSVLASYGIAGLPVLATRPDLVPVVAAALGIA